MVAWEMVTQTIAPGWAAYAEKLAAGGDCPSDVHS